MNGAEIKATPVDLSRGREIKNRYALTFGEKAVRPIDEGKFFRSLDGSIRDLAKQLGKHKNYVHRRLQIVDCGSDVQQLVIDRPNALSAALEIERVKNPEHRRELIQLSKSRTSLREIRSYVNQALCCESEVATRIAKEFNFRQLRNEPRNEQEIIFLFGMISSDLNICMNHIWLGFPDCEAQRLGSNGQVQNIMIEFEVESRNFFIHDHDPSKCDLIVCWRHNWPESPVQVLELKSEVERLISNA